MLKHEFSSFRDHKAIVYFTSNRVFRKIKKNQNIDFEKFLSSKFYQSNLGKIIETKIINFEDIKEFDTSKINNGKNNIWLEHKKLKNIIYPYEYTFNRLKDSAIFFLNLYIETIKNGYDIADASAYNIQFKENSPIFIDLGSFVEINKDSEILWHKQFCENYFAPLLLKSTAKVNFNDLYKASLDGVDLKIASKILPIKTWLNFNILTNIHLHSYLNSKISSSSHIESIKKKPKIISIKQKILIIKSLNKAIKKLKSVNSTYWSSYSKINSYSDDILIKKKKIVADFIKKEKIKKLIDIGCNNGIFSDVAFKNGAYEIIGIDNDIDSLDEAYVKFRDEKKNHFAIYQNFMNPSPNIGWRNLERKSFLDRFANNFDGMICLAFIHHICIGNNVPLDQFIEYLGKFSSNILLEFVSTNDQMVKNMTFNKKNIIQNYSLHEFKEIVKKNYKIQSEIDLTPNRTMLHFKK